MFAWQATVQDEFGNAVPLPVVTVYLKGTETLAAIYAEDEVTPLGNPMTGTLEGFVQFWAKSGQYTIIGSYGPSNTKKWEAALYDTNQFLAYSDIASLKSVLSPSDSVVYAIANENDFYQYTWVQGSTEAEDLVGMTVISGTGGRWIAVGGGSDPIYVLLMGQSNAVGAAPDTTGSVFSANSRVKAWNEITSAWVTPTVKQEPFNPSGSNNAGLDFCNRIAEETGRQVRLILIATGSTQISAWTGSSADRTISVGNRPRYVELQTAMTAIGQVPDVMLWIQGEADGNKTASYYAGEFEYLLSEMTVDGYLTKGTPVVVSQIYQGQRFQKGNQASQNSVLGNANIHGLLQLGDPRLRIANSSGIAVVSGKLTESTQTASVHFTDSGLRTLGRERLWAAWRMAVEGFEQPIDFGLEMSRTERGYIAPHYWGGGTVPANLANDTIIGPSKMGELFDLQDTASILLPDYTHPTKYSSGIKGRGVGLTVYFRLTQVGSATIGIEPGGTGGIVRFGALYSTGALETSITLSAAGASTTNQIHMARWTGARWDIWRLTA